MACSSHRFWRVSLFTALGPRNSFGMARATGVVPPPRLVTTPLIESWASLDACACGMCMLVVGVAVWSRFAAFVEKSWGGRKTAGEK